MIASLRTDVSTLTSELTSSNALNLKLEKKIKTLEAKNVSFAADALLKKSDGSVQGEAAKVCLLHEQKQRRLLERKLSDMEINLHVQWQAGKVTEQLREQVRSLQQQVCSGLL